MLRTSALITCLLIGLSALGCSKDSPTGSGGTGETFELRFGSDVSDEAFGIVSTDGNSVILAGQQGSFRSDSRAAVQKVSDDGSVLWQQTFGSEGSYRIFGVTSAANGDIVAVGTHQQLSPFDYSFYAVRVSSSGNAVWEREYGSGKLDEAQGIAATDDGGFIIAGNAGLLSGTSQIMLIKIDADGNSLWTRIYHSSDVDFCSDIIPSGDGGFIVVGQTEAIQGNRKDVFVLKVDADGDEIWRGVFGGTGNENGSAAGVLADGRIAVAGWTQPFGIEQRDGYVVILSSDGSKLNEFTVSGTEDDALYGLAIGIDDGIILCGHTEPSSGHDTDLYLLKASPDGSVAWSYAYGGDGTDRGRDVIVTADAIYTCGVAGEESNGTGCCSDIYLIKTNLQGVF